MYSLCISITDFYCRLFIDNYQLYSFFKKTFYLHEGVKRPHLNVILKEAEETAERIGSNLDSPTFYYSKENLKKNKFKKIIFGAIAYIEYFAQAENIIFLHASSLIYNHKGYVFCGPSGIGKTTVINKAADDQVYSDDFTVIKKVKNGFFIYPSPFDKIRVNNFLYKKDGGLPVKKIFFLNQSTRIRAEKLKHEEALEKTLHNNILFQAILTYRQSKNPAGNMDHFKKIKKETTRIKLDRMFK